MKEKYTQSKKHGRKLITFNMEKPSKYKILLSKMPLQIVRKLKNIFLLLLNIENMQKIFLDNLKKPSKNGMYFRSVMKVKAALWRD